jgi:hypothetical protein
MKDLFLSDSRWRLMSNVQDGGRKSRKHNLEIWQYFCIQSSAMSLYFDQQHYRNSQICQKWWNDPRWRIKIRLFSITLKVSIFFQSFFSIWFMLVRRWRLKKFFRFQSPSWIF